MLTLTMQAPGKNALGISLMEWLTQQLASARGEPIFLTGAGECFSAGLNLKELSTLDAEGMGRFLATLEGMVDALYHYPGPTIAWVNGHAIAGGCVVALACDHRLATDNPAARIGLNEAALGLMFPPKTWRLVESRLPVHSRERVLLEGALHAPEVALRLGLVDELVADEAAARAYAERVVAAPRENYAAVKRAIRDGKLAVSAEDQRRFEAETLPGWRSPELRARLLAVLDKGRRG